MIDTRTRLICELIIKGIPLTKSMLIKNGIKESEINQMLDEGMLKIVNEDLYELYSLYELYYYGVKLLSEKEVRKANICFKICHQLNPNNRIFLMQLFCKSLKLHDYKMALERLSKIEKIESDKYEPDNNLYLYLLSMLTPCPEEYQEKLYSMDYDSILLPTDSQEYHKDEMNNIRHLIMKNKYNSALRLLNKIILRDKYSTIEQETLKELLQQVIDADKEFKMSLLKSAKEEKYGVICSSLLEISHQRYLSNTETYIYLITKTIIDILRTSNIPESTIIDTDCIYEAIKGNNFALAKSINDKIMKAKIPPFDNQIIDILLKQLNRLILDIKTEQYEKRIQKMSFDDYAKEIESKLYPLIPEDITEEEITLSTNLTEEDILIIKLIKVRYYYTEGMYLLGDALIKEVEKSQFKTPKVTKYINEIRTNKKFYIHRPDMHTRKRTI